MAKSYNSEAVEKELTKLSIHEAIDEYNRLGVIIHNRIVSHQEKLGAEQNEYQTLKDKLKIKEIK